MYLLKSRESFKLCVKEAVTSKQIDKRKISVKENNYHPGNALSLMDKTKEVQDDCSDRYYGISILQIHLANHNRDH